MIDRVRAEHRSASPLLRQRIQLIGALIAAVALPYLFRIMIGTDDIGRQIATTAAIGNMVAIVMGHYMFRSLTAYPGLSAGSFVLPSFAISYGVVLAVYWVLRLDYSRFLFLVGLVIGIAWYVFLFLLAQRHQGLRVGIVPFGSAEEVTHVPAVSSRILEGPTLAHTRGVGAIVADFRADIPAEWERFLADCALRGTIVYHFKQLQESLTGRVQIDHLSENTFGSLVPQRLYVKLKRSFDFLSALAAAALLLPLFVIVAVVIKLDSPGPVLFRQKRMGAGGHVFRVCKFRTMRSAADSGAPADLRQAITLEDDPRITRAGRWLRRTRVDELPQIINILRGEMSWIGPRPEAEILSRWYESEIPFYRYRHIVKPGISGWAQVNQGHVAEVDQVHGKLQYDFYYIKYFSPWLDVLIIFKTIGTVVTGFGSK